MAEKSTFDLILQGIGNFLPSTGKAISEIPQALVTAPPAIFGAISEGVSKGYEQKGLQGGARGGVDAFAGIVDGILNDTLDFWTKPGAGERIAEDPARALMDVASVLSGGAGAVGKLGKVTNSARLGKVAELGYKAANVIDPMSLALETGKLGLRKIGAPQALYSGLFEKLSGTKGKLDDSAIQSLTATANESGYVRSQKGKEKIAGDIANLSTSRKAATDTLTSDIPIADMQKMYDSGMHEFGESHGAGTALTDDIAKAKTKAEDFLYGTAPGKTKALPGRRATTQEMSPGDPDTRRFRAISGKEVHQKSLKVDNDRLRKHHENAMSRDPNFSDLDMDAIAELNKQQRKYIGTQLGPNSVDVPKGMNIGEYTPIPNAKPGMPTTQLTYPKKPPLKTGFEESGQQVMRHINLRKADDALKSGSSVMGAHQTATEAAGLVNPSAYSATYSLVDKFWKNPTARTKLAASINNKSRGNVAKGLRGARRTLYQLGEHEQPTTETGNPYRPFPE